MATQPNIREELTLGIDLGIGSCGWAVIAEGADGGRIVGLGVRTFDVPETAKERTPTNQLRRQHRGLRKVLRRRRQRMNALRDRFKEAGLIESAAKNALRIDKLDPWKLRAEGLDRRLSGPEFAVALGHIAKHRGFRSNRKRQSNEVADDSNKVLKAIEATRQRLQGYRTVGEMFAKDGEYAGRKRNRDGDYTRSILRDDQQREIHLLFDRQRQFGNSRATAELESRYADLAFTQLPLADSEGKVGWCPLELQHGRTERRAAKRSHSFELFRFLSRLAALRLREGREERTLTPEEIAAASANFGTQNGMTFKRLRKLLGLDDGARFDTVPVEEEGKRDVVNRTPSNGCMQGSKALRDALGPAWPALLAAPDKLDRAAFVLTFREDSGSIGRGLAEIGFEPAVLEALMRAVRQGDFAGFKGAGHVSAKACRAIVQYLREGKVYSEACAAAGYDHARRPETKLDEIANPVARKALTEAIKQVRAIVNEYGLPGRIHVELARDVGKSKEERDEIKNGIEKRNKAKDRLREQFAEDIAEPPGGPEDLMRYELWREQNGRCLYTDQAIPPNAVVARDNSVQVDHILPWSRSGDDSFVNKTLCLARANQEKRGRTPYEWFGREEARWSAFLAAVESNKAMQGRKKRNYLLKDASVLEEKFRPRNLNDTRYATRLLRDALARWYPADDKVHVYSRPGPLTDRLRRAWGIQDLKKNAQGERLADDRHHALDALVVAATSQSALQRLTVAFRQAEAAGLHRDFAGLPPPWPGFVAEARSKLTEVFVSRAERHRARGEAHAATVRSIGERDGAAVVFERRAVDKLTPADLERLKDPERNMAMLASLRQWIEAGKPKGTWPLSPKGDAVRKVSLVTNKKLDVLVRDGAAERGEMVRVDVFRKQNRKGRWEFFLVPIYPHQVFGGDPSPPNRAIQADKPEEKWPEMTEGYEFLWSLMPFSYAEVEKSDRTFIAGYFRGAHRTTGALNVSPPHSRDVTVDGIGTRTLLSFRKFHVDRLGRRFEIKRETRTWHGAACT